ncbi:uncharacterized protein LOC113317855 [Papaver somniferum]|uniref:uncharacterized protein LOC113317855 n=1 Tax=Papaver somniferum TaxID=3469 RepID=UPI000E70191E|nr:uncharacterized protein LOC113317855 [Papaver somniferum]
MSGFWTGIGDKKPSHKSIKELAQEHVARYEFPTNHNVNSYRDYYGHLHRPELPYTDPNDYSHMYHSAQCANEHFYGAPPTHSSSMDHLISRVEVLEAGKFGENVAPKSSSPTEVIVCLVCRSTNHLTKHCPEVFDFRQSRMDHDNFFYQIQESTPYSQTCDLEYLDDPNFACTDGYLQGNPYVNTSGFLSFSDPHEQPCTEHPPETMLPSTPLEQLNMLLKMNLIHLQNGGREEFQDELFVSPNELNFESNAFIPTRANNIEYEPDIEVHKWSRDTMVLNGVLHPCYDDDDNDLMLEEHVYSENVVVESSVTVTLDFVAATLKNDVSSDFLICNSEVLDDVDIDLGLVQMFCDGEHNTQLMDNLGKVEFSVDTNDHMCENNLDVSSSLPMSKCVVYSDFLMHEMETLNNHDYEFGLVELFYECEHAATLADDLGDIDVTNNDVSILLLK